MPSLVFILGSVINSFGDGPSAVTSINAACLNMTIIACVLWVSAYLYYVCLVILAERIVIKTKVHYLRSLLLQDIAWYDSINVTELNAKMIKEC